MKTKHCERCDGSGKDEDFNHRTKQYVLIECWVCEGTGRETIYEKREED